MSNPTKTPAKNSTLENKKSGIKSWIAIAHMRRRFQLNLKYKATKKKQQENNNNEAYSLGWCTELYGMKLCYIRGINSLCSRIAFLFADGLVFLCESLEQWQTFLRLSSVFSWMKPRKILFRLNGISFLLKLLLFQAVHAFNGWKIVAVLAECGGVMKSSKFQTFFSL